MQGLKLVTSCSGLYCRVWLVLGFLLPLATWAQTPIVSNVNVTMTGTVATITYDLSGSTAAISVLFS